MKHFWIIMHMPIFLFAHGVTTGDQGYIQEINGVNFIPFIYLGAKHMVTGYDHLLFLIGVIFFLYRLKDIGIYQKTVVKGDARSFSIAAASIIAKVTRDRWIIEKSQEYPEYEFEQHKGYGTRRHMELLKKIGPCSLHRKSFAPVRDML